MAAAFDVARPEVTYADKGAGGESRRQRRCVDKAGRAAPEEVDQCCRSGDITPHHAKCLAMRTLDRSQPMHCAVAFGDPIAARAVHANSMDLVEISHRAVALGDIANLCDGCDITIHRIDRLEANELRSPGIGTHQAVLETRLEELVEIHRFLCRLGSA